MRWFWIDRFVEFTSGQRAVTVKNISLAEEQLDGYMPTIGMMPSSLIIEGLAQTGGLLVAEHNQFRERVVLAKVAKATFHQSALAGDTLRYTASVADIKPDGAIVEGTSYCGETLQAEIELVFAHLDHRFSGELFYPADFLGMLRCMALYEVGKTADGQPLEPPPHLLEAESLAVAASGS